MTTTLVLLSAATCLGPVDVSEQHLRVAIDPAEHRAVVTATLSVTGAGAMETRLAAHADDLVIEADDAPLAFERAGGGPAGTVRFTVPDGTSLVTFRYTGRFEADVAAGEIPGQVHNFSVDAHVGDDGIFLSDGSAWHPRPLDENGAPQRHMLSVAVEPIDGWAVVASGNPRGATALDAPCWDWAMPRPADGLSIVGNRHVMTGIVHETEHGPVEIVMHVPDEHAELAPMFLEAASSYLDVYVPRLGAYPYQRFSIIENFFSSGFAYPGFTVLGPRVVGMAPRSLMPGFLDHELLHNWWGNGVYVSAADGNWCEALTSYCTNYFRRSLDGGEDALRDYRRTTLMKLSADPDGLDDGPPARFGSADPAEPGPSRFVGYDKGAFLFAMLEADPSIAGAGDDRLWRGLRRFAEDHMGRPATWDDLRRSLETTYDVDLAAFWDRWIREHTVPRTPTSMAGLDAFLDNAAPGQRVEIERTEADGATWIVIDPDFRFYRALPPAQTVPLIGGTTGPGGLRLVAPDRPEVAALSAQLRLDANGENLMLVGRDAVAQHAELIARAADSVTFTDDTFTVAGTTYDGAKQAILHTMTHPDRPGRFITVFLANGATGWARLRLVPHYRRDTTVVWDDGEVVTRRVFEPDRRIRVQ